MLFIFFRVNDSHSKINKREKGRNVKTLHCTFPVSERERNDITVDNIFFRLLNKATTIMFVVPDIAPLRYEDP